MSESIHKPPRNRWDVESATPTDTTDTNRPTVGFAQLPCVTLSAKTELLPIKDHDTALEALRKLPESSIVGKFCRGTTTDLPPGATHTKVHIFKGWHQNPFKHISVELSWTDANWNVIRQYASAHVQCNGIETVFECGKQGKTKVMPLGQLEYDEYDYYHQLYKSASAVPGSAPPPWRKSNEKTESAQACLRLRDDNTGSERWKQNLDMEEVNENDVVEEFEEGSEDGEIVERSVRKACDEEEELQSRDWRSKMEEEEQLEKFDWYLQQMD